MKKLLSFFITAVLMCPPVFAGEYEGPHIMVTGYAIEEVIPDEMLWHLIISQKDMSLEKAGQDHKTAVVSVLSLLKNAGIPEDKIQTTRMNFGENVVQKGYERVKQGYIASTTVTFTLTDFGRYNALWSGLTKIPGVSVKGVSYNSSSYFETLEKVRINALLDAKEKAAVMAKTLSADLGKVLGIHDSMYMAVPHTTRIGQYEPYYLTSQYSVGGNTQIPVALGKIPVSANINVDFELN